MNNLEIKELLYKASQSIGASELLFNDNFYDFAASRSYYAMFYTVEALLLSKNLSYSKHSAVISEFWREFIKTGLLDKKFHQYILDAFDLRNTADYGLMNSIEKSQAKTLINNSKTLLNEIKKYLNIK